MRVILLAVMTTLLAGIGCQTEEEPCTDRATEYTKRECECLRWYDAETAEYTECMRDVAPAPVHKDPSVECKNSGGNWSCAEEYDGTKFDCFCARSVSPTVQETLKAADDFMAKERCLRPMLAKDAKKHGCYLYDGAGGVEHFCECIRHLKRNSKRVAK